MSPSPSNETWILVADAGYARIFSAKHRDGGLQEIVDFQEHGRTDPDTAGYSDRPGRVQESASSARHGMEPRTDDHTLRARRFATEIADFLLKSLRAERYRDLITVAPSRFASMLDHVLDDAVKARRIYVEHKDLVHESATALYRRLADEL